MKTPPDFIDGAKVIKWIYSENEALTVIYSVDKTQKEEIFGIAICQYPNSTKYCRFYCNKNWKVIQDTEYDTLDKAIELLPSQLKPIWNSKSF